MLGRQAAELLARCAAIDTKDAAGDLQRTHTREIQSSLEEIVKILQRRQRSVTYLFAGLMLCGALATFAIAMAMGDAAATGSLGSFTPAVGLVLAASLAYLSLATHPLFHRALKNAFGHSGFDVYVLGATPFRSRYLILGKHQLMLIGRCGSLDGQVRLDQIDVIGVVPGQNAVGLVLSVNSTLLPLSCAAKVGGPAAQGWSMEGILGARRLQSALVWDLERRGIAIAEI